MEKVKITPELNKKRLDACLSELLPEISRNQLKNYIEEGYVRKQNSNISRHSGLDPESPRDTDSNNICIPPHPDPLPQGGEGECL